MNFVNHLHVSWLWCRSSHGLNQFMLSHFSCLFVSWFVGLFVGLLVCLLVCWFVCWFVGLLVCWFVGLFVCWLVGLGCWFVSLFVIVCLLANYLFMIFPSYFLPCLYPCNILPDKRVVHIGVRGECSTVNNSHDSSLIWVPCFILAWL